MSTLKRRKALAIVCGRVIRFQRKALGWSQAELADAACLRPSTMSRLERGDVLPDLETMFLLEDAFDWERGQLSGRVENAWNQSAARTREQFAESDHQTSWWDVAASVAGIGAIEALAIHVIENEQPAY